MTKQLYGTNRVLKSHTTHIEIKKYCIKETKKDFLKKTLLTQQKSYNKCRREGERRNLTVTWRKLLIREQDRQKLTVSKI